MQVDVATRNARADAVENTWGATPVLKIFTGSMPANCAAANTGTNLVNMTLPADAMSAASAGAKAKTGTWQVNAAATGTPGYFRIYSSDGTTCRMQGTVTATGGGGDMTINDMSLETGVPVTVVTFGWTEPNA